MTPRIRLIWLFFWQYLNQPLFDSRSIWTISRFYYLSQIQFLENCFVKDITSESRNHQ
jgi:hypothetical protein